MSTTASLTGTVNLTDNDSGTIALQKSLIGLATTGTNSVVVTGQIISTSTVTITLPISPTQFLYLKNNSASQAVTAAWTPNGGSSATILVLEPGSAIMWSEVASGGGITAFTVVSAGTNTPIEYVLLG